MRYKLAKNLLTFNQFMNFMEGRDGHPLDWSQVADMTPDNIRDAESQGCRPYLFGKRVHVLGNQFTYTIDEGSS